LADPSWAIGCPLIWKEFGEFAGDRPSILRNSIGEVDTALAGGNVALDDGANLEATDGNLVTEPNAEIEPVSHALRYLVDAD